MGPEKKEKFSRVNITRPEIGKQNIPYMYKLRGLIIKSMINTPKTKKPLNKLKEVRTNIMQELQHNLKSLCTNCKNLLNRE